MDQGYKQKYSHPSTFLSLTFASISFCPSINPLHHQRWCSQNLVITLSDFKGCQELAIIVPTGLGLITLILSNVLTWMSHAPLASEETSFKSLLCMTVFSVETLFSFTCLHSYCPHFWYFPFMPLLTGLSCKSVALYSYKGTAGDWFVGERAPQITHGFWKCS